MRWTSGGRSRNLEDRRGARAAMPGIRLGGGRRGAGLGLGGILALVLLSVVFKQDFLSMFMGGGGSAMSPGGSDVSEPVRDAEEEELVQFVSFVLDDTQSTWTRVFPTMGGQYREARLVLFRDAVESACGFAQSATGPFYCPGDEKIYIDLGFYDDLRRRFGAPGDFAQAYVLAHEIGHHVQNQLGIEEKVRAAQSRDPGQAKALSVRMELQADCFAGVWARSTADRDILERGDLEEGLGAAAAVGDDRIQKMSGGRVMPESFTHGSSEQRMQWFRRGFEEGSPSACNTFGASGL